MRQSLLRPSLLNSVVPTLRRSVHTTPVNAAKKSAKVQISAIDLSRMTTSSPLFAHIQAQRRLDKEHALQPWERQVVVNLDWESKYPDERAFYFPSQAQNEQGLDARQFKAYCENFGRKYLAAKHNFKNTSQLLKASPNNFRLELSTRADIIYFYYLLIMTQQQPALTHPIYLPGSRAGRRFRQKRTFTLSLSKLNSYRFLANYYRTLALKDETDFKWSKISKTHNLIHLDLQRMLAEGQSEKLNKITQTFIDYLKLSVRFKLPESKLQHRNISLINFFGLPRMNVQKKWGGLLQQNNTQFARVFVQQLQLLQAEKEKKN